MNTDRDYLNIKPKIFVLSGLYEKKNILSDLKERLPEFEIVKTVVSSESRSSRNKNLDYVFVSQERFRNLISGDTLICFSKVLDEYVGVHRQSVQTVLDAGKNVFLRLDVSGAITMKKLLPNVVLIYLFPETDKQLNERLKIKEDMPADEKNKRIEMAKIEQYFVKDFDYVVPNPDGDMNTTTKNIMSIVKSEAMRLR